LSDRERGHTRAFLKVQDGCDAHCTYCIIPQLRTSLWSKSLEDAVAEASNLVAAGHREIVLTGIFLGAYGQPTALRRRQSNPGRPIGELVDALCTRVPGLRRLRLSSLEPGDLTDELISIFKSHPQVVPHFHLPLQSGSDRLLRRMNRQYNRDEFLRMVEHVHAAFDRPAITTDIIVGFPGETDAEFVQTLDVVRRVRFIHIHAFPFSPRPRTAAARWTDGFVPSSVVTERMDQLQSLSTQHNLEYREQFVGETVELLVERNRAGVTHQHGRCARYFDVHFEHADPLRGRSVHVRVDRVTPQRTHGTLISIDPEDSR
jgi:threonylcarbamoyladenosine tRNA methylthiotransferase MtaB